MEMRQEADVTSKLDHPCVVSFVGISIRPDLLMCLELAPLGSLRRVLDNEIEGREPFNKYRDKEKVFLPVFNKEINFKLVHQVISNLVILNLIGARKIFISYTVAKPWYMELKWAKESRKEWFQICYFKICIEFELLLN